MVVAVGFIEKEQRGIKKWRDIVAISLGQDHAVGLKSDGTVVACGMNASGECDVGSWRDIVAVSAGSYHTVGLKSDGTVVACGDNYKRQCNVSDWRDIVAVSAGYRYTVGIKSDGTVVACGDNNERRWDVSAWRDIVAVSFGSHYVVGLKSDGTVVACGDNNSGECDVGAWRDIVAVAAGCTHTVGLKSDGTVVACGTKDDGRCDVSDWKLFDHIDTSQIGISYDQRIKIARERNGKDQKPHHHAPASTKIDWSFPKYCVNCLIAGIIVAMIGLIMVLWGNTEYNRGYELYINGWADWNMTPAEDVMSAGMTTKIIGLVILSIGAGLTIFPYFIKMIFEYRKRKLNLK